MTNINYSITIPHYNNPDLLLRMLKSIPERDDIQVIVIDDASSAENKAKLSLLKHKNLEIISLLENRGGGYARNVGLDAAKGRWIIGVDCDDYFSDGAFDILDKYKDENIDCLFYSVQLVDLDNNRLPKIIESTKSTLNYLEKQSDKNLFALKYKNTVSWNKMVSMKFIKSNDIRWENCRVNIDVLFSFLVTTRMASFKIIPDVLYNLVISDNSITRTKRSLEREFQFYLAAQKRNGFFSAIGLKKYPYYRSDLLYVVYIFKKRGIRDAFCFVKMLLNRQSEIVSVKRTFLNIIK